MLKVKLLKENGEIHYLLENRSLKASTKLAKFVKCSSFVVDSPEQIFPLPFKLNPSLHWQAYYQWYFCIGVHSLHLILYIH